MYPPVNPLAVRLNVSICRTDTSVSDYLHVGQWPGCREWEEIRLEGLWDCHGEVGVSDCLSYNFFGMKSALCSCTLNFLQVETHSSSVPLQGRAWQLEALALNYNS